MTAGGHAIVVADGDPPTKEALDRAWPGWDAEVAVVIAADGGARTAERLGLRLDAVVGDLDSLGEEAAATLERHGVSVIRSPAAKDETDTELAIVEAARRGARSVAIVGALGGDRVDHGLANVGLLGHPALAGLGATIVDRRARLSLLTASPDERPVERRLPGPNGGLISLIPFGGDAVGVTTAGLRYSLRDEDLPVSAPRGVSNVRVGPVASVRLRRGRLLIVEVAATLDR
ncbi:MAG TPA: thiamine diphosphokinase [Candidatus Limnocylindrales bacterium]